MVGMLWNDAPILYFHFNAANGLPASLPMTRQVQEFAFPWTGIPGTKYVSGASVVPGYRCSNCRETFFAATQEGLKHGCMNNGGIVSGRA
jgi:hypothetical protein